MREMKNIFKCTAVLLAFILVLAGCSSANETKISVMSVSEICGLGSLGNNNSFPGVVSAQSEIKIEKDQNKTIKEVFVKEGDTVSEGQVLFSYDNEEASLTLEKSKLELEQLKNSLADRQNDKKELEAEKSKASSSEQLSYTLAIQEADTDIRETEYNIGLKEKEIAKLEEACANLDVFSPINGKVQSYNPDGGYDNYGNQLPFLSIVEVGIFRIKGYINENNAGDLIEGSEVEVFSRKDNSSWKGYISGIDWENGTASYNSYVSDSETSTSTKYPFYVEVENSDDLILGQHVYIKLASGDESDAINLPSYYLFDIADGSGYVWAENSQSKLVKVKVQLGEYNEENDTYPVLDGIDINTYLAFPEEGLSEGMGTSRYEINNEYDEYSDATDDYAVDDYAVNVDIAEVPSTTDQIAY